MMKIWRIFSISLLIFVLLPKNTVIAANVEPNLRSEPEQNIENAVSDHFKKKLKRGAYFLLGIESKLKKYRDDLSILKSNITALHSKIEESKVRVQKLESQIENLSRLIEENENRINAGERLSAEYENRIFELEREVIEQEKTLKENFEALDKTMTSYYLQTNSFFNTENQPSLLAFLASNGSTGEILQQNEYLFFMKEASESLAAQILNAQETLDSKNDELKLRKEKLGEIQTFLEREKRTLESSMESRARLLSETKGKQEIYEMLLNLSRQEIEQVDMAVKQLKENYEFFQTKLDEMKHQSPEGENSFVFPEEQSEELLKGKEILAFPVSPSLGISAYFHDSAYQKAIGIQHNAIDIRIIQGSKVKAAADGVVSKVVDNGYAYSYIILAHPDRMLTLYGHMSEILVSEGEIVRQGQTIGLSGGIPGTKGAGWLTTGAHLHFEVFKDFIHTDPLEYLPLEYLPIASLPEKYLKKLTDE